jgi:hypothetical protein
VSAGRDLVKNIRPVPVTKESIVPLVVATVLPIAAVAATQAPSEQILGEIKGFLLF